MGEFPKSLAFSGKYSSDFFNRRGQWPVRCATYRADALRCAGSPHSPDPQLVIHRDRSGELRHIQKLRYWPLDSVLHDKYLLPKEEADMIASFLNPMLRLNPDKRAKASELIHHAWLEGVVVQGEIDIIRRAEDEEARRKRLAQDSSSSSGQPGAQVETQTHGGKENMIASDVDAMKPVDDVVVLEDADGTAANASAVPTLAAPTPGAKPGHARTSSKGEVPTLTAVPPHGKGRA
ncbi:hypothetical protein C8Q80DRAFT_323034 [Daedaleopsis nitida]|nr:hypothetical protein C8Q80DRAFT_323034 [Daedaleopsis nitida]